MRCARDGTAATVPVRVRGNRAWWPAMSTRRLSIHHRGSGSRQANARAFFGTEASFTTDVNRAVGDDERSVCPDARKINPSS
ncbi:hypothetical protein GCM10027416_17980 [Okibacterium endophyticum]